MNSCFVNNVATEMDGCLSDYALSAIECDAFFEKAFQNSVQTGVLFSCKDQYAVQMIPGRLSRALDILF